MKTIAIFSTTIILFLIIGSCRKEEIEPQELMADPGTTNSAFRKATDKQESATHLKGQYVIYKVNVHISSDSGLCTIYMIEITDLNGHVVVPAKEFIPGVRAYEFHEPGPVTGIRVARLSTTLKVKHVSCFYYITTAPDVMAMEKTFRTGETYSFDLYPQLEPV
jgi:hypothetical protein